MEAKVETVRETASSLQSGELIREGWPLPRELPTVKPEPDLQPPRQEKGMPPRERNAQAADAAKH